MSRVKKRGVSPLIATVLLIGFTVAIVSFIIIWGKGFIGEKAEKEGALAEAKLGCQGVDFTITGLTQSGSSVGLTLKNKGTTPIDSFIFRGKYGDEAEALSQDGVLDGLSEREVTNLKFSGKLFTTLEVIPQFKLGTNSYVPCTAQSVEARVAQF